MFGLITTGCGRLTEHLLAATGQVNDELAVILVAAHPAGRLAHGCAIAQAFPLTVGERHRAAISQGQAAVAGVQAGKAPGPAIAQPRLVASQCRVMQGQVADRSAPPQAL
ncbi:hypothetical protein D3C77_632440 [compost metagenome]